MRKPWRWPSKRQKYVRRRQTGGAALVAKSREVLKLWQGLLLLLLLLLLMIVGRAHK